MPANNLSAIATQRTRPRPKEAFHAAIAVAQQQKARIFELRAAMSMARLWRGQGKRDEARELLQASNSSLLWALQ